jgi:hypothetical protein
MVDHRADLYAMGIILYEMLTGRLPFEGQTPLAVILQHVRDEVPPPSSLNPALAPVWDEVIRRSLAKDPNDRYPSAQAMDDAIQSAWQKVRRESGEWHTVPGIDPSVLYDSAARALAEGDWQRVISLCGQLLEIDPAHPDAVHLLTQAHEALRRQRAGGQGVRTEQLLRQADEALADGRYGDAVESYQAALESNPDLAEARRGLERAQREGDVAALYRAARADLDAERWDDAAARLDQLLASAPNYRDAAELQVQAAAQRERQARLTGWYDLAMAAVARQDWPAAVQALEHVVAAAPGYRDAAARLAEARQAADVQQTLASARATLAAGDAEHAVALLETVVGRLPGHLEARTLLAQARAARPSHATVLRHGEASHEPLTEKRPTKGDAPTAESVRPPPSRTRDAAPPPPVVAEAAAVPATLRPEPPAVEPAAAPNVFSPAPVLTSPGPRAGQSLALKLAVGGGLVAAAILGVVLWPRPTAGPAPAPVVVESNVAAEPQNAATATEVPPTAVPTPSAADLFPACQSAVAASDWTQALAACEQVSQKDAAYDGLADALATTYLALGKEQVAQGAPLSEAVAQFDKALAAKPDAAEAEQQRSWALAYLDGQDALAAENWPLATEKLDQVYTVAPDYRGPVDGGVKQALYSARLGWGEALLAAGSYADARAKCAQALALVPDSAPATNCQARADAALAPPPTPAPVFRPAPTAVPRAPAAAPAAPSAPSRGTSSQPAPAAPPQAAPAQPAPAPRPPAVAAPPTRAPAVDNKPTFTPRY